MREHLWRARYRREGGWAVPLFKEYVENGGAGTGLRALACTAMMTLGDPTALDHLAGLWELTRVGATCMRLANDLRSHDREMAEGNFNALALSILARRQEGRSEGEAQWGAAAWINAEIACGLDQLGALRAKVHTATGEPEAFIADVVRFACNLYVSHDHYAFGVSAPP